MDLDHLRQWIGRREEAEDEIAMAPLRAMAATLDRAPQPVTTGAAVPPLWHWLYFLPTYRTSEAGPDGHAARGGFLPPVPLPRRMWAGGRLRFPGTLRAGETARKVSEVVDVRMREGRSGPLAFVVVRHEIYGPDGLAVSEEHDIVYRGGPALTGEGCPAAPDAAAAAWSRSIEPGPLMLFRYSALTFNGHRIHYDRDYCRTEEGYPGLVVHGPLTATLLAGLAQEARPGHRLETFEFRATAPVFDTSPLRLHGRPDAAGEDGVVDLWAEQSGRLAMTARAILGPL